MTYKNFEIQLNKDLVDTDEKIEDVISLIAMDSLRGEILILRSLVVFKPASSRSSTIELLLSAEELCTAFSIDVQDLNAVDIHSLLSNTPAWLLFLAFLY